MTALDLLQLGYWQAREPGMVQWPYGASLERVEGNVRELLGQ